MSSSDLIPDHLRVVEREIDEYYRQNLLVSRRIAEAGWYFLAFCEEVIVREIVKGDPRSVRSYDALANDLVMSTKAPLNWLFTACPAGGQASAVVDWDLYEPARHLLELSQEYAAFESAFTWASLGLATLDLDGNTIKVKGALRDDVRYQAYDLMTTRRYSEMRIRPEMGHYFERVAQRVKVHGDRFECRLTKSFLEEGLDAFSGHLATRFKLPGNWAFDQFTWADFVAVAKFLLLWCSVYFHARMTAARKGCPGLCIRDALIVTNMKALNRRIREFTGLSEVAVKAILELLTYGAAGLRSADPALQPLVPLGPHVALSPNLVINSALERNFAVLLNRLKQHREAYAEYSQERESSLKSRLIDELEGLGYRTWSGIIGEWNRTEIDLVVICERTQQCSALELKAFITPAEPREIRDRSREIARGIEQVRERRGMTQIAPEPLRAALGISADYVITWAVASETSVGGEYIQQEDVAVVQSDHLIGKLRGTPMNEVAGWLTERRYLPVSGVHYEARDQTSTIGKWNVELYGLKILDAPLP